MAKIEHSKVLAFTIISSCQEVIRMRSVVDKLMKSCQRLSSDMQSMVNDLTGQSVDIAFKPSIIFINFRLTLVPTVRC